MTARPWRQQYDRMQRWFARYQQLKQGRLHDVASDNYVDDIYAFFQNCYHLKDWIKNDPDAPEGLGKAVEEFINSNRPLRLCADLCNGLKHLGLDRKPRSGEAPTFGKKLYKVTVGNTIPTSISLDYQIETTTGPIEAFELASQCVAAWDLFIASHAQELG
jgi:hypothetical protein